MKTMIFLLMLFPLIITAQTTSPEVIASSGDHFSNATGSLSWTLGETMTETFSNGGYILTQGFQQPVTVVISGIDLDLLAFLEGPFESGVMDNTLNTGKVIPLAQPYNTEPWNYAGPESVAVIPNTEVIDWVLIELRDAPDATSATSATLTAQQAAFVLNDGSIVGLNGSSNLSFDLTVNYSLFVVVWHRNHLGIMSANPLTEAGGLYSYNFSNGGSKVFGGVLAHKEIAPGTWGMVAADGNADGQVNNADKNEVWNAQAGMGGYLAGDFNLDAQANNGDKNEFWVPNSGSGGQVPDGAINGYKRQVPE